MVSPPSTTRSRTLLLSLANSVAVTIMKTKIGIFARPASHLQAKAGRGASWHLHAVAVVIRQHPFLLALFAVAGQEDDHRRTLVLVAQENLLREKLHAATAAGGTGREAFCARAREAAQDQNPSCPTADSRSAGSHSVFAAGANSGFKRTNERKACRQRACETVSLASRSRAS